MFGKKNNNDKAPGRDNSRDDDLGPYPADINDNPTRQSVLERALRLVVIAMGVSALINVALAFVLIAVFPLKQVYPYLVTFREGDEQVVAMEPLSTSAPGIQYATEANVRQYVKLRHSFAPINSRMDAQWGPDSQLAAMTVPQKYEEFKNAAVVERARMMDAGYTRQIEIESATMLRPDTWQVNFKTIDSLGGANGTLTADPSSTITPGQTGQIDPSLVNPIPQSSVQRWVATMTIGYDPQTVSYDKRLLNPLGFTVTDYSVTARN